MLAVNYTNLRDNMKHYMDQVTDDYETMIVTRKNNKNVVILSEETYNNLMENVYVMGNKANYDWLMESKAQFRRNGSLGTVFLRCIKCSPGDFDHQVRRYLWSC